MRNVRAVLLEKTKHFLETEMGIIFWIVIGLGFGALANWMMPVSSQQGMLLTLLAGLAGGIAGGFAGTIFGDASVMVFSVEGLVFAGGGAVLFLLGLRLSKSVFYLEH